jgi:APA family basic amino acid/polyamine antiporter
VTATRPAGAQFTPPVPAGSREPAPADPGFVRAVSLLGVVALCVGNMAGTSLYTLPASLAAATGPLGIVAWGLTAAGYALVAVVYAGLGARHPRTGGPYVFARLAFGDGVGFATVWAYWVSTVVGNAAIVTSVVGYLGAFAPALERSGALRFAAAQALVWGLCWLNVRGVRGSARLQAAIMLVTVVPLLLLSVAALGAFRAANLVPFAPNGVGALAAGAALVVWAYSGVESATVPAEEVRAPERTIARGTILGYLVATAIFLLLAVAVAGALPNAAIASSPRPLAHAMRAAVGPWAATAVAVCAVVSGVGTLNGWTLMAGRIPVSAARDGLFFPALARLHPRHGTPHVALVAGAAVTSAMLALYFTRSLLAVFNFVVLLAVLLTLLPHLFAMAAAVALARRERRPEAEARRTRLVAGLACAFVLFTIYGVGAEAAAWGAAAMAAGGPVYWYLRRRGAPAGGLR